MTFVYGFTNGNKIEKKNKKKKQTNKHTYTLKVVRQIGCKL